MHEKRISISELEKILSGLDMDEGVRIESRNMHKKIFINKNLLGVFTVLIKKNDRDNNKGQTSQKQKYAFFHYTNIHDLMDYINNNVSNYNIWLY
ncbi:MAG: hypothetical protein M3162_09265 [Thermoproteota archaeon]|nr:hypothetical protein [Thermoproteota archaeon]